MRHRVEENVDKTERGLGRLKEKCLRQHKMSLTSPSNPIILRLLVWFYRRYNIGRLFQRMIFKNFVQNPTLILSSVCNKQCPNLTPKSVDVGVNFVHYVDRLFNLTLGPCVEETLVNIPSKVLESLLTLEITKYQITNGFWNDTGFQRSWAI